MYEIILIDLSLDPERSAEHIYHKLKRLPLEFRQKLEMMVEELPLTGQLKADYSSINGEDSD